MKKGIKNGKKGNDHISIAFLISKNIIEIYANKCINLDEINNFPDKCKLAKLHEKKIK